MRTTEENTPNPLTRRSFIVKAGLFVLGFAPLLNACTGVLGEKQENKKKMDKGAPGGGASHAPVPPIDLRAPAHPATASFALG